ncbi:hypothetical protein COF68_18520 [Bacillus toyonensis]|nr:hypothetical protein CON93_00715 [Bacillus toyonensis]PEA71624.1 hypothetical protein COO00_16150 [Bacillus toyonensis]PEC41566.1 hypothetical protein CON60_01055 [Bacillus toyonensis]PEI72972.1 hypothetical protein CN674_14855 [Bacillus toyonensis]PEK04475.1 hypothetical protein CN687_03325 [Bacillus toyonensis]
MTSLLYFYYCNKCKQKAKVARSECEVDGASDLEAPFASGEEAKPPNILATVAGLHKKRKWLAQNLWTLELPTEKRFLLRSRE